MVDEGTMTIRRRLVPFVLVCSFAASALAQNSTARKRDPAAAEVLFEQGRTALEAKDFRAACAKFAESYRFDPAAGTVMNWATCEEKLGRLASAWQHWREAISVLAANDEREAFAREQVDRLEARLPYLTVQLDDHAPPEAGVFRDGVAISRPTLGLALPVDPGEHRISVKAPGYEERSVRVVVTERETKRVRVSMGRKLPEPVARTGDAPSGSGRTLGWIAGGVGVAGGVSAVVTGVLLSRDRQTVRDNCVGHECNQTGLDAARRGKTLLVVNTASWATAVVGIGIGTVLVISGSGSGSEKSEGRTTVGVVEHDGGVALHYARTF
jgi:hypothetical protein